MFESDPQMVFSLPDEGRMFEVPSYAPCCPFCAGWPLTEKLRWNGIWQYVTHCIQDGCPGANFNPTPKVKTAIRQWKVLCALNNQS